jgi:FAD/FMN-containing dehydrogenase
MDNFVVDRLRETLRDRVTTAMDPTYDEVRTTFNATVARRPEVIVRVHSDDDVVKAVVAASDLGLPIAIRGGGHSVAGHGMADGALVVDMRERREVSVDPATGIVRVAGGAVWEDVDAAAWEHHLAVVGGTFGDTGVAGLTLGGGIGWLSGLCGFTCDNLIRAEVISAAGERLVAGPDGDPDLLWALRGGGGNFGVVTAFEFQAVDPGPILAGYVEYPISAVKQVLRHLTELAASAPDALELTAVIGPHGDDPSGPSTVRVGVCWPGETSAEPDALRRLRTASCRCPIRTSRR